MQNKPLPRLDIGAENIDDIRQLLLPYCRLKPGEVWYDPEEKHIVACGDAADSGFVTGLFNERKVTLAMQDPPYNVGVLRKQSVASFIGWCRRWVDICWDILDTDASFYIWLGADQTNHYQPLSQFMAMMAETPFKSRSFITMRNQRGYGTQKNWMAVRQELLYYVKGKPSFSVQYTDIPKILRGYYRVVGNKLTENLERSHSKTIRPGNVWVDIQQVFYRMEENVSGCFAQKPLKATERIILASSVAGDTVADFFAHAGTTLIACERTNRRCVTFDIDPIFTEITIRRLEHYRATGKTGWQGGNAFEKELNNNDENTFIRSA